MTQKKEKREPMEILQDDVLVQRDLVLPLPLDRKLVRFAGRNGTTPAAVILEALEERMNADEPQTVAH